MALKNIILLRITRKVQSDEFKYYPVFNAHALLMDANVFGGSENVTLLKLKRVVWVYKTTHCCKGI